MTAIFGIGPVIAATIIGDTEDITRFPARDKFAAWTGTARPKSPPAYASSTGCPPCSR